MLEYIQIYPDTLELVAHYGEAERCRLYESMARYAFTGALPEWPESAPEWYIWPALRQLVDKAARRIEQNRANASRPKRNRATASETEQNAYSESESDIIEEEEEEEDDNTREVADAWSIAFGKKPTAAVCARLSAAAHGFGPGVLGKAIRITAAAADRNPCAYALSLLRDWRGERLSSLDDVEHYLFLRDGISGRIPTIISAEDAQAELNKLRAEKRSA